MDNLESKMPPPESDSETDILGIFIMVLITAVLLLLACMFVRYAYHHQTFLNW